MTSEILKSLPSSLRRFLLRNQMIFVIRIPLRLKHAFSVFLVLFLVGSYLFGADHRTPVPSENSESVVHKPPVEVRRNGRLFYNRVPKCGSSTVVKLLEKLAKRNGFTHVSSTLLDDWALFREADQESFTKDFVKNLPEFSAFDRHLFFVDFTKYGMPNPIYINIIRDPTERFLSEFYFRRQMLQGTPKPGEKRWYEDDLDKCIAEGTDYDCRLIDGTYRKNMIAFFCGNKVDCSKHNDREALESAKRNVENFYEVVGTLEDLELTLSVLEHRIPSHFAGITELYRSSQEHVINKGRVKPSRVSEETKAIIRKNLTAEYEFYNFVRQRLLRQSRELP